MVLWSARGTFIAYFFFLARSNAGHNPDVVSIKTLINQGRRLENGAFQVLTPSIPTPSPTESLPVLPPSDEVKTTTEAQGSGQDLTLIWMAISVWIICFCAYAVAGEEQHTSAERHRALSSLNSVERLSSARNPATADQAAASGPDRRGTEMLYSECCLAARGDVEEGVIDEATSENVELDACSICLDPYEHDTMVKKMRCGHFFHPDCINVWLEVSPRCPLCRQDWRRGTRRINLASDDNIEMTVLGNITQLHYSAMLHPDVRFGVTIASTSNGLLVTYVEPEGSGEEQSVEVGDYLVRQDGELIPRGISDSEFVAALVALARPVELGFSRQIDEAASGAEMDHRVTADNWEETRVAPEIVTPVEQSENSDDDEGEISEEEEEVDDEEGKEDMDEDIGGEEGYIGGEEEGAVDGGDREILSGED